MAPARTASGYRKFSQADVERLRLILAMQRDNYIPHKVIRQLLEDLDAGREPQLPGGGSIPVPSMLAVERRVGRDESLRETGASAQLLQDAISAGLVPAGDVFDDDALQVLRALAELQRSGIEPRHLRSYRQSAQREVALIESALVPLARRKDAASRAKAAELAGDIAAQLEIVRSKLIRQALAGL